MLASPDQGRARHSPVAVRLPLLPLKHPVTSRGVATISCAATAAPRRWTHLPCAIQSSEKWPRFPALHLPSQVVDASAVCCTVAAAVSCVNPSLPRRRAPLSRRALPARSLQRSPSSPPTHRGDGPHHGSCCRVKADGVSSVPHPLVGDVATFSFAPAARPCDGRLPRHPSSGPTRPNWSLRRRRRTSRPLLSPAAAATPGVSPPRKPRPRSRVAIKPPARCPTQPSIRSTIRGPPRRLVTDPTPQKARGPDSLALMARPRHLSL